VESALLLYIPFLCAVAFCMRLTGGFIRNIALLLWLLGIGLPAFAATPISVEKLEQWLSAAPGKSDAQIGGFKP
jgi:hypothetical protein